MFGVARRGLLGVMETTAVGLHRDPKIKNSHDGFDHTVLYERQLLVSLSTVRVIISHTVLYFSYT